MSHFTRRNALKTTLGLIGLTLILNTGCGGGDDSVTPAIDPTVGSPKRFGNLEVNLTTNKGTYSASETVSATTTLKNVGTATMTISTADPFVFTILANVSTSRTFPDVFTATPTTYTLQSGETKTYVQQFQASQITPSMGKLTVKAYLSATQITQNGQVQNYPQGDVTTSVIDIVAN